MADQIQGNNFTSIGAAATTLVANRQVSLRTLAILGTGNGTLAVYDSESTAGTATGNLKLTIPFLTVVAPAVHPLNVNFSNGIVTTVTGTINAGIGWS